ncbi:beta strand repeat-containing protein [Zobellia russellii]|uniref:beta strand repeat-containing protein n=1 Tax=Zobellia russellii TaxID=248907 RepID=UPI001BFF9E54|nr:hypothetical protein [Zobellia russellii]MBT9190398.1 hypothetical protein [Zobellia russellii]
MQKRISIPLFFVGFFLISFAQAQVKIGDNPQTIDPASILELESSDKVLVITRVDSLQMTTIVPNRGALVYNTTADCVYYYDGAAWISMCEGADGGALTATPIVNSESTIVITQTAGGNNFEIAPNSITSDQILNGGINGVDIQNGSIGRGKLAPNAVDKARIAQNAVGPYAIDRDSLPLSFFNNDAGFITGANVVSGDADNSISVGSDSGAFFDATTLEDNIAANTAAIAADGDKSNTNEIQTLSISGNLLSITNGNAVTIPTADGSDTNINQGNNITITGNGTAATPYVINAANEVDGSITNELITGAVLNAANELVITEAGTNTTVDLSSLAGGGALAQINSTATVTVSGDGSAATPYTLTANGGVTGTGTTADPFSLSPGAGGQWLTTNGTGQVIWDDLPPGLGDDQNAGEVPVAAIPVNYTAATADVEAHLAGIDAALTGGSTDDQNAGEVPVALTATNYTAATQDVEAHLAGINTALGTAGTAQNLSQVLTTGASAGNLKIVDLSDPTLDQDAATKKYVDDEITANNTLADGDILVGDATGVAQAITLSGDATIDNAGVLTVEDDAIDTDKILDATIGLTDLSDMGATADGQILKWDTATTSWIVSNGSSHFGTENAIFFGDDVDGSPTDAGNEFYWDPEGRKVSTLGFGALYIGLDGALNTKSTVAKVQIMEQLGGQLSYALHLQNDTNSNGSAVATLFAVDGEGGFGKGALAYERTGAYATGDFHFLQNSNNTNESLPTLTDKAFTIKNNRDIVLYGGVEIEGLGTGTAGQVLTSTGTGVEWGTGGSTTYTGGAGITLTGTTFAVDNLAGEVTGPTSATVIADDVIGTDELAPNAVFEENINANAVTSAKIAPNTIAIEDLSPMGATANGQVLKWDNDNTTWTIGTDDTTAGGGLTAVETTTSLTGNGTSGSQLDIADDAISTDELAVNAVFTENINAGAVTADKIGENEVTVAKIAEGADGEVLTTNSSGDVIWAPVSGTNLSTTNLTQTAGEDRTYNLNGSNLYFDGAGLIGIGTTTPAAKFHVSGGQVRAATFSAGDGFAYGFSSDPDTGMYREEADKIAFDVGGNQALTIDEPRTGITNVTVNGAFSTNIRNEPSGGVVNIAEDDYTVIISNATSVTLPTPSTSGTDINIGKIYILKNITGGLVPISSYSDSLGNNVTDLQPGVTQLQSDGTTWHQIN